MDLDTINEYIFIKHNIFPGTQRKDIVDVARNHLGLHSARIMTPYTTLCSRINGYNTKMLTSQLYEKKNLIKMRCMRTTLHMVPLDIASILHMATLDLRLAECRLFCSRNNIDINFIKDIREELIDFVDSEKSSNEIESKILDKLFFCEIDLKRMCKKDFKIFMGRGSVLLCKYC